MVRIYLQYSYGGFKTFYIEGTEKELVNKEVTLNNTYGFPKDAYCYFQYGGAKLMYRYLNDGKLDLVVREIPSIHTDGDGRSIRCAVQFVGDPEERNLFDYMVTEIANNFAEFHDFFQNLFGARGGLHIDGDILREWISRHKVPFVCESPSMQIQNIRKVKSGVILFVPISPNFGIDKTVTDNVTKELGLPNNFAKENVKYIRFSELEKLQGKSNIIVAAQGKPIAPPPIENGNYSESSTKEELITSLNKQLSEATKENTNLKSLQNETVKALGMLQEKNDELKEQNEELVTTILKIKRFLYIAVGIAALLGIFCMFSFFK